jgi:plasmid stabilization system protein ParE
MNIVYSPRATRDLEAIAAYYRAVADPKISAAIGERIGYAIGRLAEHPYSGTRVSGRSDVRSLLALRYPYRIFYRVRNDAVEILHIRHTSRRPWQGEE